MHFRQSFFLHNRVLWETEYDSESEILLLSIVKIFEFLLKVENKVFSGTVPFPYVNLTGGRSFPWIAHIFE